MMVGRLRGMEYWRGKGKGMFHAMIREEFGVGFRCWWFQKWRG